MTNKPEHILVVEDEQVMAEIIIDYLKQSGFTASHIGDGNSVVDSVKQSPPDLVLLDLMLPGRNGMDICKDIRAFSGVPIIMVTAKADEIDRLLGLEIGADDYICKPFSPREVVARVKAMFRRSKLAATPEPAHTELIQIDDQAARVSIKGEKLDLTPTEFRLFKLLAGNPGRVYSRAQLLDMCYQQEQQNFDRVIDSHIKNLRKKVAKVLPEQELIHAVYGVGYRFEM